MIENTILIVDTLTLEITSDPIIKAMEKKNIVMEICTKEIMKVMIDMVKVLSFGLMEIPSRGNGIETKEAYMDMEPSLP